ncbi:MAG: hypothetical protein OXB96_02270 [Candidatus Kaiserbacteria bacterium]|nr:hypothetical protein [Candidatus Kaiserbacteria bacterium]
MIFKNSLNRIDKKRKVTPSPEKETKKKTLGDLIGWVKQGSPWKEGFTPSEEHAAEEEYGDNNPVQPQETNNETVSENRPEEHLSNQKVIDSKEKSATATVQEDEGVADVHPEEAEDTPQREIEEKAPEVFVSPAEKEAYEKLTSLCIQAVEKMQEEGIFFLDKDGRIDMTKYTAFRNPEKIEKHIKRVKELEYNFGNTDLKEQPEYFKRKSEYLEMMAFIVFVKCGRKKRIGAFRTAKLDDFLHHFDGGIFDLDSGEAIVQTDEVLPNKGRLRERRNLPKKMQEDYDPASEEKWYKVMEINKKSGVTLEYGFIKNDDGSFSPSESPLENLPLVHLSLFEDDIISLVEKMDSSIDEISKIDEYLFKHFVNSIQVSLSDILLATFSAEEEQLNQCVGDLEKEQAVTERFDEFRNRINRAEKLLTTIQEEQSP